MISGGMRETFRGRAPSNNCREWVYFDCYIDTEAVRRHFTFADCVIEHAHRGTHDGRRGALSVPPATIPVMGAYEPADGVAVFQR
jgi:hypothetical protein